MKKVKKLKKEITIDDLAMMVANGFNEVGERLDKLEKGQVALEKGQAALEKGQAALEKGQKALVEGQEEIKMQLNRRVHIFDHKDLEFRVEKLEERAGISRKR